MAKVIFWTITWGIQLHDRNVWRKGRKAYTDGCKAEQEMDFKFSNIKETTNRNISFTSELYTHRKEVVEVTCVSYFFFCLH